MSTTQVAKAPRIGAGSAGLSMSPEEFDAIRDYDDRYHYELIRGVLVVSPIPSKAERGPNDILGALFDLYQTGVARGAELYRTLPEEFIRVAHGRRRADRVIWAGEGRSTGPGSDIPAIAIEFVSKARRDRARDYVEKRAEYLAAGVSEYWVIDRFRRTMTAFRNPPATAETVVPAGGIYRTELLPGFELPLASLLAAADDWKKSKRPR